MNGEEELNKKEIIDRFSDPTVEVKPEELRNVFKDLDPDSDRDRNN